MKHTSPFLKWAGGKRWLTETLYNLPLPPFTRYIEPFLGSGAIFFHLRPSQSVLSDLNRELIDTYCAIRDDWRAVFRRLVIHQDKHSKSYYYRVRSTEPADKDERAARFIYLNRSCWNGLYRVNRAGKFNVPIGTKTQIVLPTDNFSDVANILTHTQLHAGDFA